MQLAEKNRELARLPEVRGRPEEFRRWAGEAEAEARALEAALRRGEGAAEAFRQAEASCRRCPAPYRDVPQRP